jgi:hypothetical protein
MMELFRVDGEKMTLPAPKFLVRVWEDISRAIRQLRRRHNVHFLHIGKTGGTAIKYVLERQQNTKQYSFVLHSHETTLRDVPKGEYVIFFLRDPITRFTSAFYSRQRQGQPRYFSPWSTEEESAFQRFDTPNKLAGALSSDDQGQRSAAAGAMQSIEHVRTSYWKWFENEPYFRSRLSDIFFIGFQETLDSDFESLRLKLGLGCGLNLPVDDIEAHKNPGHLDRSLDEVALRNLREWYAADYEFLSLCKGLAERINGCAPGHGGRTTINHYN